MQVCVYVRWHVCNYDNMVVIYTSLVPMTDKIYTYHYSITNSKLAANNYCLP